MDYSSAAKLRIMRYPHTKPRGWQASGRLHPQLGKEKSLLTKLKIAQSVSLQPSIGQTRDFCCLLGIIWGDGTIYSHSKNGSHCLRICCGLDETLADECVGLLQKIGLHPHKHLDDYFVKRHPTWKPIWGVTVYSKKFVEWLRELSLSKLQPYLDDGLVKAFWQGMYKAEGYLALQRGRRSLYIANTNKELTEWGAKALSELGFHPKLYIVIQRKYPNWKPLYRIALLRQAEIEEFLR